MEAQHIDHGILDVVGRDAKSAIVDIGVLLVATAGLDADGVALIAAGKRLDLAWHGGREQQRLAGFRRRVENELEILAEAEVEHFVGLVEHDGLQRRQIEAAALEMIAQAAGRTDHDVGAGAQLTGFLAAVHAADAGCDPGAGFGV